MTGGMICPPHEAVASTAAAIGAGYPDFFIMGIVMVPSTTTLATALPLIVPNKLDETIAMAGPPLNRPIREREKSVKNAAPPTA